MKVHIEIHEEVLVTPELLESAIGTLLVLVGDIVWERYTDTSLIEDPNGIWTVEVIQNVE